MAIGDFNPRGAVGHSSLHAVLCGRCGTRTEHGAFDWLGRYQCNACQQAEATAREDKRLAAVAAEVAEHEAMWCLPSLGGA